MSRRIMYCMGGWVSIGTTEISRVTFQMFGEWDRINKAKTSQSAVRYTEDQIMLTRHEHKEKREYPIVCLIATLIIDIKVTEYILTVGCLYKIYRAFSISHAVDAPLNVTGKLRKIISPHHLRQFKCLTFSTSCIFGKACSSMTLFLQSCIREYWE